MGVMTNQEILTKAIKKAIAGGWTVNNWTDCDDFEWRLDVDTEYEIENLCMVVTGMGEEFYLGTHNIIFDHDFAKALWGETVDLFPAYNHMSDTLEPHRAWQYHLQAMVIAEDPIKYLGENL